MNGSEGDDLLSHRAAPEVPSALADLTAGFGMGPGVSLPLVSPKDSIFTRLRCTRPAQCAAGAYSIIIGTQG